MQLLPFKVECLFLIGSPLGLFLALEGLDPVGGRTLGSDQARECFANCNSTGLPAVRRLYNMYHPYDPVGYRLVRGVLGAADVHRNYLVIALRFIAPLLLARCSGAKLKALQAS